MGAASEPEHLSKALSELIAARGLARVRGDEQLRQTWREVAGEQFAADTKVLGIRNGVLRIGVSNSALLGELVSYHRESLLQSLQQDHAFLKIRDVKFRLKGNIADKRDSNSKPEPYIERTD